MSSIDTMVTPRERGVSTVATTLFTFRHAAPSRSAPQRVLRRNDAVHQPILLAFVRGRGLQPLFRVDDRLARDLVDILRGFERPGDALDLELSKRADQVLSPISATFPTL